MRLAEVFADISWTVKMVIALKASVAKNCLVYFFISSFFVRKNYNLQVSYNCFIIKFILLKKDLHIKNCIYNIINKFLIIIYLLIFKVICLVS